VHEIHDPGLTPGGITDACLFVQLYSLLQNPRLVVTSPLRRCLQTTTHAFLSQIESSEVRVIAHPDLQAISTSPCDTGTPLDVLRAEFPLIEFSDDLFPEIWPRSAEIMPVKENTIYDDVPAILGTRAERARQWLKDRDEVEIVVVTHASFAHFLFNDWRGEPGDSVSNAKRLDYGLAQSVTLPGNFLPGLEFQRYEAHEGFVQLAYPPEGSTKDEDQWVQRFTVRDCGIFTERKYRG
jgi:broad specificity phosphatase PhoE